MIKVSVRYPYQEGDKFDLGTTAISTCPLSNSTWLNI
jgi:hypothetical protein